MRALRIERSVPRFVAARVASGVRSGAGGRVGPLRYGEIDAPARPGPDWVRVRPRLSGICGSDLATVDGHSSPWFEPIVSFPFVPGHEVVGETEDGRRVVVQPVLGCAAREITPLCSACAAGRSNHCVHLTTGHLRPGLQTGYCHDTGGGWSEEMVAHPSQLHAVPEGWSDEAAVMIEPIACALHAALAVGGGDVDPSGPVVVVGAGTLGLGVVAALRRHRPDLEPLVVAAKHPSQRRLAAALGATVVVEPTELVRAVRRLTGTTLRSDGQLAGGARHVVDCVGSAGSLAQALAVTAPGGEISLVGMPGRVTVDLTPLWQREIRLRGAYAYAREDHPGPEAGASAPHSFDLAFDLVAEADLGRLVDAHYPLDRHVDAIAHAATAGRRGATKVVFDLRRARR